jgi:AcrR family transcriptional regulator
MARTTKAQSEATAAKVLLTARRLFVQHGYAGVGLEEVALQAGVTRGAVYHHYASKLGLFEAVLAEVQRSVAAVVQRDTSGLASDWDKLEVGCRTFLSASAGDDARRVMLVDAPAVLGWTVWRAHDAASSGRLLDEVLDDLAVAGELGDVPVRAASALLSGAMNEAALWVAAAPDPQTATAQAWTVLHRMLRALRS